MQDSAFLVRASMYALAGGSALCISGAYDGWVGRRQEAATVDASPVESSEPLVPMLGALLVYRYQALSEGQLQRALEQQRREGRDRRLLGEILLEMGYVSPAQLRKALEYQQSEAARIRAARGASGTRSNAART